LNVRLVITNSQASYTALQNKCSVKLKEQIHGLPEFHKAKCVLVIYFCVYFLWKHFAIYVVLYMCQN